MSREWIYIRVPARASEMAHRCANTAATRELCIFMKRLFYGKKLVLNQAIVALRQSIGLPGGFVTVWKNRTGHTHTTTVTLWRMCAEG